MIKKLISYFVVAVVLLVICLANAFIFLCFKPGGGCDFGIFTSARLSLPVLLITYGFSLLLWFATWRWTARQKDDWKRMVTRILITVCLLTPGVFMDPGGGSQVIIPSWILAVFYVYSPPALLFGILPISAMLVLISLGAIAHQLFFARVE